MAGEPHANLATGAFGGAVETRPTRHRLMYTRQCSVVSHSCNSEVFDGALNNCIKRKTSNVARLTDVVACGVSKPMAISTATAQR
eukprot:7098099-Pyramimonas_sp.AAC.1